MTDRLYTAKDIEKCYPWISAGVTNHRVTIGAIPLAHKSPGTGIPNMFTLPELVHAAVVDELATLGVFGKLHDTSVNYQEPFRSDTGQLLSRCGGSPERFYVDLDFYVRWKFRVVVEVQVHHEDLPGQNTGEVQWREPTPDMPFLHIERIPRGWGRYYYVLYAPETDLENKSFIQKQLDYWLSPTKARFTRTWSSKAFIRVRRLYELAADALNLPKD